MSIGSKSSNISVWGETGRYPLSYQSICLTSFRASPKHICSCSFEWAEKIEIALVQKHPTIVKCRRNLSNGPCLRLSHTLKSTIDNLQTDNNQSKSFIAEFANLWKAILLPSKKFRVENVVSTLTNNFTKCWEHEKCRSSKLNFYHTHKTKFARETYLDEVRGLSSRFSTTKLGIISRNVEVERGRYTESTKETRIWHRFKISIGANNIEHETHFPAQEIITSLNQSSSSISSTNHTFFYLNIEMKVG